MPLVSVLMPSYNHEQFISAAIESVLNQTFADFELIIIDDASEDDSRRIIESFSDKDDRIEAIFHKRNMGIARTINDCIEKAKGKFIAFIASDDLWVKDKLKKQLEVLAKDENLVVWSEALLIDGQGNLTGELFTKKHGASKKKKSGDIFEDLLKGNVICCSSVTVKRGKLEGIRFDEHLKYLNDHKFMVDLARRYKYYFIPEALVMYRIHGRNIILSDKLGRTKDRIIMEKYFLREYGNEISSKARAIALYYIGVNLCHQKDLETGRKYMLKALRKDPLNIKYLLRFFLSLLGLFGQNAYNGAAEYIKRIKYRKYY